jgi:NitT/TauT family transport system substrate-binding protein
MIAALAVWGALSLFSSSDRMSLRIELGTRSLSKLPYFVALDQGLFEKHGLDVAVYMPQPEFAGGKTTWTKYFYFVTDKLGIWDWKPDVIVRGGNSHIVKTVARGGDVTQILLGSNDCIVRTHIIADKGIKSLNDLQGKRIGVSTLEGNTGFAARVLAEHMGWDPMQDFSMVIESNNLEALKSGRVDAFFSNERSTPAAIDEGYPVLASLSSWGEPPIIGNSVRVKKAWLADPQNREAARRFLKATAEGIALFHQNRELVLEVIGRWYGVTDRSRAEVIYNDGRWTPRKPYPCYKGIDRAIELYDLNSTGHVVPTDFYDDSLIRELDESGFIDSLYSSGSIDSTRDIE